METDEMLNLEHPLWKLLPLHPQPCWLESLSSYLTRLAEANGLKSRNEIAALAGIHRGRPSWRFAADYPSPSLERIACLVGCSEATLLDTTFFHLARHFGHPTRLGAIQKFFQGSLSSTLRYCPCCLADHATAYYRLLWRFLAVAGCHKHGCLLLPECGHCHIPIPLHSLVPHLTRCPACQRDLRACEALLLSHKEEQGLTRVREIEMLLMPAHWAPEITSALVMGRGLMFLRQSKHLTLDEAANFLERKEQVIVAMEHGHWYGNATFLDYLRYTDFLDCSLSELVEATLLARRIEPQRTSRLDELAHLVQSEEDQRRQAIW
jgi:TniQ